MSVYSKNAYLTVRENKSEEKGHSSLKKNNHFYIANKIRFVCASVRVPIYWNAGEAVKVFFKIYKILKNEK